MHRRDILLTALAIVAVPSAAIAQQQRQQSNTGVGAGDADRMGEAERQHAMRTLAVGAVALETSRIAMQKAQAPWAKKFAQFEIAEQETIAEVLKSMGVTPPKPDEKHAKMIEQLKQAQAGPNFDREYVKGQKEGHLELLKIQEDYIKSGQNPHHVNMAKLARGMINEHIDLLGTVEKDIKT